MPIFFPTMCLYIPLNEVSSLFLYFRLLEEVGGDRRPLLVNVRIESRCEDFNNFITKFDSPLPSSPLSSIVQKDEATSLSTRTNAINGSRKDGTSECYRSFPTCNIERSTNSTNVDPESDSIVDAGPEQLFASIRFHRHQQRGGVHGNTIYTDEFQRYGHHDENDYNNGHFNNTDNNIDHRSLNVNHVGDNSRSNRCQTASRCTELATRKQQGGRNDVERYDNRDYNCFDYNNNNGGERREEAEDNFVREYCNKIFRRSFVVASSSSSLNYNVYDWIVKHKLRNHRPSYLDVRIVDDLNRLREKDPFVCLQYVLLKEYLTMHGIPISAMNDELI